MSNKSLKIPEGIRRHKYFEKWTKFHLKNRHIMKKIVFELDRNLAMNKTRASVKHIIISIRYDESIKTYGDFDFKISDAFTSIYGHIIVATFPRFKKLVALAKLRSNEC